MDGRVSFLDLVAATVMFRGGVDSLAPEGGWWLVCHAQCLSSMRLERWALEWRLWSEPMMVGGAQHGIQGPGGESGARE